MERHCCLPTGIKENPTIEMENQNRDPKHFIAFDLGATSGRTILGTLQNGNLTLKELTRFPNAVFRQGERFYWNIFSLYERLREGLQAAAKEGIDIVSVGIDTWGVDFVAVGHDGSLLGLPRAYRDPHTEGIPEAYFSEVLSKEEVYEATGIQIMNLNTLYQLYALRLERSPQLAAAERLLFMPDALSYMLTGRMVAEYTIASTSQLLNPRTKRIEDRLLEGMGLSARLFPEIVMPGHRIGTLLPALAAECGLPELPVIAVAGHDTASAVAAVPAENDRFAYLSSGTWSLMGIETREPIINKQTQRHNLTNEGGAEGTVCLLKNMTGMWILEQCLAKWRSEGRSYSYGEVVRMAAEAGAFQAMIDPDDVSFAAPNDMPAAIRAYCRHTQQPAPETDGSTIRMIFESLALKYRSALESLQELAPFPIERLHVIGGGSKNTLLNQFTADSLGIPVTAGPAEAAAMGNILLQAGAAGCVGSLQEMRSIIARSIPAETFMPQQGRVWNQAYDRFCRITKNRAEQ